MMKSRTSRSLAILAFILSLFLLSSGAAQARLILDEKNAKPCPPPTGGITNPLPTDIGRFIDENDLDGKTPSHGLDNIDKLPAAKRKFCSRSDHDIIEPLLKRPRLEGALAFDNPDGPLKTGSCWAHSRFQRSISYLGDFQPDKPKPSEQEAQTIIDDLAAMKHVVTIPGFASVRDFSLAYKDKIRTKVENWYVKCLASGDCAHRAGDSSSESPQAMQSRMDHLFSRMWPTPQIQFLRMQAKSYGPTDSHSWLLLGMERTRGEASPGDPAMSKMNPTGYTLKFIDPNMAGTVRTITYKYGDRTLNAGFDELLPYEDYDGDLVDQRAAIKAFCATPKSK